MFKWQQLTPLSRRRPELRWGGIRRREEIKERSMQCKLSLALLYNYQCHAVWAYICTVGDTKINLFTMFSKTYGFPRVESSTEFLLIIKVIKGRRYNLYHVSLTQPLRLTMTYITWASHTQHVRTMLDCLRCLVWVEELEGENRRGKIAMDLKQELTIR